MLQEASTLRPFVRKFVVSAFIAYMAGKNKIPRIIRTSFAGHRDNMINMVFVKFFMTPVTFALLRLELSLYIFGGVRTAYTFLSSLTNTSFSAVLQLSTLGLSKTTFSSSKRFWISKSAQSFQFTTALTISDMIFLFPVLSFCLQALFASCFQPIFKYSVDPKVFRGSRFGFSANCTSKMTWRLLMWSVRHHFLMTRLTMTTQTILPFPFARIKKFFIGRKHIFASSAAFVSIRQWRGFSSDFPTALFTYRGQTAFDCFSSNKVLRGGRKLLQALVATLLRYNIRHVKAISLASRSGLLAIAPGQHNIYTSSIP